MVRTKNELNSFLLTPEIIEEDYPCWEDVEIDVPEEIENDYYDYFTTLDGLKLGGWPRLIQSEIYWVPYNAHPAMPRFVFQIDSSEKGGWQWGDQGVGYFGRGSAPGHEDEWALSWQCF